MIILLINSYYIRIHIKVEIQLLWDVITNDVYYDICHTERWSCDGGHVGLEDAKLVHGAHRLHHDLDPSLLRQGTG